MTNDPAGPDQSGHHHSHQAATDDAAGFDSAASYWDSRYAERLWVGRVNAVLADEASALTPGRVLDLGAGEGGDAIWLAQHGWQVTAADVSAVALARARSDAEQVGVVDRISFVTVDLAQDFPDGQFDLVSASFLQSLIEFPRERVLRRAAAAVAPGGYLLIVDHAAAPPWSNHQDHYFPTAEEVFASLELPASEWEPPLLEVRERVGRVPDGREASLLDNVIRVRRRS